MATTKKFAIPELVQLFAAALYEQLATDGWGDIEPEVFQNIAENRFTSEHDLHGNKLDVNDMEDAVVWLTKALTKALRPKPTETIWWSHDDGAIYSKATIDEAAENDTEHYTKYRVPKFVVLTLDDLAQGESSILEILLRAKLARKA